MFGGLWLERSSIGVAKSRLRRHHAVPGPTRGDCAVLWGDHSPTGAIGMVLRTRKMSGRYMYRPDTLLTFNTLSNSC